MNFGSGILIFLIIAGVAAEVFDHSASPIVSQIANLWEVIIIFAGSLKILQAFNKWFSK